MVSHQSLGCHHKSTPGSPLMHSKLSVGGKIQAGRQGSRWWGQARSGLCAKRKKTFILLTRWHWPVKGCNKKKCDLENYLQWRQSSQPREEHRWWSTASRLGKGSWLVRWLYMGPWVGSSWTVEGKYFISKTFLWTTRFLGSVHFSSSVPKSSD